MRRMAGAAILVAGLGGASVWGWWSARLPGVPDDSFIVASPATPADSSGAASRAPATTTLDVLPDPLAFLSTAPPESLDLLPGVGPVLASRLVAARAEHGRFRSWDDVDRVRGIGPKTIERLKNTAARR